MGQCGSATTTYHLVAPHRQIYRNARSLDFPAKVLLTHIRELCYQQATRQVVAFGHSCPRRVASPCHRQLAAREPNRKLRPCVESSDTSVTEM